mgnify:CR=1 FL=1
MRVRKGYADTPSGQIHYRELGDGRPVLLLHKTPSSSVMWERVMPLLAEAGYRAIAPDNPGYGASERPASPPKDMRWYSQAMLGVLDHLGAPEADVVGFYTGASIALDLAVAAPERVGRLVLAGIAAFADEESRMEFNALIGDLGHMQKAITLDAEGKFLEAYPIAWFRDFVHHDGDQYLDEFIAYLQCARSYWWAYEAVVRHDAFGQLAAVTQPTLCLAPSRGLPFVTKGTRVAADHIAGARYEEIDGTTEVCMEQPGLMAGALLRFLAR